MNLKSLLAASALCSCLITPAFAQTAPKMRAMLQASQLDKPNANIQFETKSITEDRAVFENVVFKNKNSKKTDASFGALILERMPKTGVNADQALFTLTLQNGTLMDQDKIKTAIEKIEIKGITPSANFSTFINWMFYEDTATQSGSLANVYFQGDIRVTGVAMQRKASESEVQSVKIGDLNLLGVQLNQGGLNASSIAVVNFETESAKSVVGIGKISMTDVKVANRYLVKDASNISPGSSGFKDLSLGSLVIEKFTFDLKSQAIVNQSREPFVSVDRIEAANWTDKNIGKFGISGLKATIGQAEKRVDMSLESLSLHDINVPYFSAFGEAIVKELPNLAPKSNGRTARLDKADLLLVSSAPAGSAPTASTATVSPKLKDLLPGGPLDGGIGGMSLSNLAIGVSGFKFTIDKINAEQGHNSAGIITSSRLDPMTMKLTFPEAMLKEPKGPTALFAPLIADGIELVVRFDATYEPTTDVMSFTDLGYEFKGWAGINLALAIDGLSKYYQEQTVEAAAQSMFAGLKSSQASKRDKDADTSEDVALLINTLAPFQSVRLLGGKLALSDQGGITKVAGLFASMMPPAKSATSRTGEQNDQAITQVRQSWATPLRKLAVQKDKPEVERQFFNALARWLEVGGVMTAVMQPPEPVAVPSLADPKDLPKRLGVTFTNQLPAKN